MWRARPRGLAILALPLWDLTASRMADTDVDNLWLRHRRLLIDDQAWRGGIR